MTYSIVAYDPENHQLGVAVQSHSLCVGAIVPWVEAGVGAVATQARSDPAYGPLGLMMMRSGKSSDRALRGLLATDSQVEIRQVAMVDARGNTAVHTGKKCIEAAGHQQGNNYSVQANFMLKNTVWSAMAEAFETTKADLAQKMMSALEAAEAEGGDMRGKQSAALVVVSAKSSHNSGRDRIFDLRVDDHPEPLQELQRLLMLAKGLQHRKEAVDILLNRSLGEQRFELARHKFNLAMEMIPKVTDNLEVMFWYAITLVSGGRVDDAIPLLKQVFAANLVWRDIVLRLVGTDFLPNDSEMVSRILSIKI